jgi:DNA invertase Pin-like site-specific DNA recombinase
MSDKIQVHHPQRKAILYIRQSSAYQVSHNVESRKLQYGMETRLRQLGWQQIEVVDEDLGCSAAGNVYRGGFEHAVAEVGLGRVGAVAATEVSRFARNSREWQQLVEVRRVVDTLLVDQETVYSARLSNDRLLLGLKGSLNEYELDLLRQRSVEARREKARRGELIIGVAARPCPAKRPRSRRRPPCPEAAKQQSVSVRFFLGNPPKYRLSRSGGGEFPRQHRALFGLRRRTVTPRGLSKSAHEGAGQANVAVAPFRLRPA